jgi:hypothetical protein
MGNGAPQTYTLNLTKNPGDTEMVIPIERSESICMVECSPECIRMGFLIGILRLLSRNQLLKIPLSAGGTKK